MIQVRLIVRDRERDLSGTCHGSDADRLIAALSAEPETIADDCGTGGGWPVHGAEGPATSSPASSRVFPVPSAAAGL